MNNGLLPGFTRFLLPPGQTYPRLAVKHVHTAAMWASAAALDTFHVIHNVGGCVVKVLPDASIPLGGAMHYKQGVGAGQVELVAGTNVELQPAASSKTRTEKSVISAVKIDFPNVWSVFGDME